MRIRHHNNSFNNKVLNSFYKQEAKPSAEKIDVDRLSEEFHSKQDTVDESATMIENRTFEIASGGLVLSMTVVSFFSSKEKLPIGWEWMSIVIISIFSFCILLHYWSHYISKHNAEVLRDRIGNQIRSGEPYDEQRLNDERSKQECFLQILNIIIPIVLIIGVISLIIFTSFCILT